ncbi:MAG: crossover junction endodeoxyribonuclease RuvC [Alphaproteobacteria bacterium]|nr:crossover junction endodeoxyribonuclease RuvC [Alphaproteobacteria bacterium]
MRLLGLDPGLRATGWGIVDADGNALSAVASGTVCADEKAPLSERLHFIFSEVRKVIRDHEPDECAVEETFVNKNPTSTLKLGHARAAAMLSAAEAGLRVAEYTPNAVKKAVVGAGHAGKQQIEAMVRMLLPGHNPESSDAADALAVAICHAHYRVSDDRLKKAIAGGQSR